jgi:hypothetical protein
MKIRFDSIRREDKQHVSEIWVASYRDYDLLNPHERFDIGLEMKIEGIYTESEEIIRIQSDHRFWSRKEIYDRLCDKLTQNAYSANHWLHDVWWSVEKNLWIMTLDFDNIKRNE